ncbi:hypothetical protein BDP27DRAFT_1406602 [Rhodocollybia butyracea]|uniref:Ricin B lectin domain-containing protein n=1 Tax=Rhodocollybia butyracea TaxID=206335 RepID=A0A9P5PED1_9AGAR|nr:hypothetical protein BDP27DRAFT_1373699 [Rhodocollybia butyracea]KAF9061612.1 hypothetical protein BDP27DRAFT_1406602 [Rhodocollybia butyracea]
MFNSISKCGLLAFLLAATTANAALPPSAGTYAIQNANSSLVLNLNGGTDPTQTIIEFQLTQPIAGSPNQLWTYIPSSGNTGTLQLVGPTTFLSCSPSTIILITFNKGTPCAASPSTPAPAWNVVETGRGFFIIDSVTGLTLTGSGISGQPVSLSVVNPSSTSGQVWVFIDTSTVAGQ